MNYKGHVISVSIRSYLAVLINDVSNRTLIGIVNDILLAKDYDELFYFRLQNVQTEKDIIINRFYLSLIFFLS